MTAIRSIRPLLVALSFLVLAAVASSAYAACHTVLLVVSPSAASSSRSISGTSCGGSSYEDGTQITFTVVANPGFTLSSWANACASCTIGAGPVYTCTTTTNVGAGTTCRANF